MLKNYSWLKGGLLLGTVFLVAFLLVKPVGVSTQYVVINGIIWNTISDDLIKSNDDGVVSSSNAYLNKSKGKYAKAINSPLNYGLVFVAFMVLGGFLSTKLKKSKTEPEEKIYPGVWRDRFGDSKRFRYVMVFLAGFLMLFGARLAGGCTSGHMMSGMMQTAISGYLFAIGTFATAIPLAILLFKSKKQ